MRLVENWRAILKRAWSVRWMYGATVLGAVGIILPLFQDRFDGSLGGRLLFSALSLLAVLLGIVSRVIEQKELSGGK